MTACALALPRPRVPAAALEPLVDRFGRAHTYLRISLTERCNLRCRYCMPVDGLVPRHSSHLLSFDEIERLVRLSARMGVTRVRLTGGEPTIRPDLVELVARLVSIPGITSVGLTTNGMRLAELAAPLRQAGLTRLNVSLDTLRPERFEQIARRPGWHRVWAGIEAALAAGYEPLKINVVVIGGVNDDELEDFGRLAQTLPIEVRFIEYMPFRGNGWQEARMIPWRDMFARLSQLWPLTPVERADPHAVSRVYRAPGFAGSLGFISSMSEHFCGGCNRLRLTSDGAIKSCLFQGAELSLRNALRAGADDEALAALLHQALAGKWEHHPPASELANMEARTMTEIGG